MESSDLALLRSALLALLGQAISTETLVDLGATQPDRLRMYPAAMQAFLVDRCLTLLNKALETNRGCSCKS